MNMLRPLVVIVVTFAVHSPARAQWTEPVRIGAPGGVLYPQIVAHGDTLHVVYSNNDQEWKIGYVRSTDGGDTWSDQRVLSDDSSETIFVRIVENGQRLMVLWRNNYYYGGDRSRNIGYNISNNAGLDWSGPQYILNPSWEHILYFSASGSGPVANIVLSSRISPDLVFFSIRSTNFGESWSGPVEMFRTAQSGMSDQVSYQNMVHLVWAGRFVWEGPYETYYMRSIDEGTSWSDNLPLSDLDGISSMLPSISVDETGHLILSWTDYKFSTNWFTGDLFVKSSFDDGGSWSTEQHVTNTHSVWRTEANITTESFYAAWEDWRFGGGHTTLFFVEGFDDGEEWSDENRLEDDSCESVAPAMASSVENVYVIWADDRCDPDTDICGGIYFTRLDTQVGIEENGDIVVPDNYSLEVYPNPFNSTVIISVKMQKGGEARLDLYDVNGRLVKTLFKGGNLGRGTHKFTWDATDAEGKAVSSGLYFAVATTPRGKLTQRLTLIR